MHQIRVHLQFLGYPIVNDPLYNDAATFGLEKGRGGQFGKSDEQLVLDLIRAHNAETWLEEADKQPQLPDSQLNVGVMVCNYIRSQTILLYGTLYFPRREKYITNYSCPLARQLFNHSQF